MYSIKCYDCKEMVEKHVDAIMNHLRNKKTITMKEVIHLFKPNWNTGPDHDIRGWTFKQIYECGGIIRRDDENSNAIIVEFPDPIDITPKNFDDVSNPSHYTDGRKYEPRKVIADWGLNFNLGNAVKYISRAGRKGDKIEDLRKAIQYIEFEIEECENDERMHGN